MRVRLYRGPQHGKCYDVPDDRGSFLTANMPDRYAMYRSADTYPTEAVQMTTIEYRMKMVQFQGRMIPSIDPQGYVCFEYQGGKRK